MMPKRLNPIREAEKKEPLPDIHLTWAEFEALAKLDNVEMLRLEAPSSPVSPALQRKLKTELSGFEQHFQQYIDQGIEKFFLFLTTPAVIDIGSFDNQDQRQKWRDGALVQRIKEKYNLRDEQVKAAQNAAHEITKQNRLRGSSITTVFAGAELLFAALGTYKFDSRIHQLPQPSADLLRRAKPIAEHWAEEFKKLRAEWDSEFVTTKDNKIYELIPVEEQKEDVARRLDFARRLQEVVEDALFALNDLVDTKPDVASQSA